MSATTVAPHHPVSFHPADLAANRAGQLSAQQVTTLRAAAGTTPSWLPGARVAAFVVSSAAVGWMLWRATSTGQFVAVIVAGLALDLAVPVAAAVVQRRRAAVVNRATVHAVEGALRSTPSLTRGSATVEVGGRQFVIRPADAHLFRRDATYRCFFTELADGGPRLLSAELLDTGGAARGAPHRW